MIRRIVVTLSAICLIAAFGLPVTAQQAQWAPGKTVKLVVPYAPGGSADVLARLLAQSITQVMVSR